MIGINMSTQGGDLTDKRTGILTYKLSITYGDEGALELGGVGPQSAHERLLYN